MKQEKLFCDACDEEITDLLKLYVIRKYGDFVGDEEICAKCYGILMALRDKKEREREDNLY